jgi:hypothetical protein
MWSTRVELSDVAWTIVKGCRVTQRDGVGQQRHYRDTESCCRGMPWDSEGSHGDAKSHRSGMPNHAAVGHQVPQREVEWHRVTLSYIVSRHGRSRGAMRTPCCATGEQRIFGTSIIPLGHRSCRKICCLSHASTRDEYCHRFFRDGGCDLLKFYEHEYLNTCHVSMSSITSQTFNQSYSWL